MMAESYESEALAAVALERHAERKRRRGYISSVDRTHTLVIDPWQ
jgi:hypothetical protein